MKKLLAFAVLLGLIIPGAALDSLPAEVDESVKEVLFIDASVSDPDALALMARPGVEVIQLDPTGDEWQQMGDALQGRHGIKAVHVVSHGGPGVLQLGRQKLDREALGLMDQAAFENIRAALNHQGEVLLYGCEVASGSEGTRFLKMLSDRLGTVVTASVNKTGSSSLGGDWVLEASTGQAHISPAFEDGTVYDHTLPVPRVEVYQSSLWVRPGEASYTWTIGPYTNVNGTAQPTGVSYGNVPGFEWYLNRGVFQYSTNNGSSWNNMTVNNDTNLVYYNISGSIFRFLDQSPLDTTADRVGHYLQAPAPIYGVGGSGTNIYADTPPTDITSDVTILLDDTLTGATVATLTPTDTGLTLGGHWVIDSQSVPNLFTIQYNNTVGNTATLSLGTGTIPAGGTNVTVTVRYYDPYDTDSSGVAIPGDGFSKLISFEVVANATQDLNFNNESVVNTYTTDSQSNPSVATLSNGNYVVVWDSLGEGKIDNSHGAIYGRIYNNLGVAQGSPFVISNASATSNEQVPTVIALNDGRFAVAYMFQNANGTDYDVGMRLVESNGTVGSQIKINTVTANFYKPAFTTLNDGSIQVVYSDLNTGDLYAQHLAAADGVKIGGEESIAAGEAYLSGVAPLDNGGYVMSWIDYSTGKAKFKISTESAVVNTGIDTAFFYAPILVPDVGGFLLVTDEYDSGAGLTRIKAVRYSNTGTIVGTATIVNAGTEGNHYAPSVARLSGGGFIMAWQSDTDDLIQNGIFGRRFDSSLVPTDVGDFQINQKRLGDQTLPAVTALANDTFAAAWMEYSNSNANVETRVLLSASAASLATVTTATQGDVTSSSATLGGEVTSDGGAAVSDRGIVWGTSPAPTTANNKVANGSGTGTFSATVTSLPASTLIYVRAYAINSEGPSYGSEISFTTSAPVAAVGSIFQGSFVGNGTARTISIPTVTPTFVMVKNGALSSPATQQHAVVRVAGMTDSSAMANAAVYADGITGLTSGGFTLGADAAVNESGTTIHWLAIKDVAGEIKTGSYVGNGGDNRGITGVGFQPDLVWVIARAQSDGGTSPAGSSYRTSTMSGDTSLPWSGTAAKADYIQAISSDGFEVGTNTMVNASGVTYYYLAMKNTAGLFNVGTYVGNATDNRQLTGFGFAPDAFFTKSASTGVSGVFKLTSTGASTDLSYLMNMGYPVADLIQKLLPDGVELGTATRANTNGAPFHWFGMKASPIPSGSATAPTVTTPTSASVTHNSATLGGNVTADGGASITERGVVYALTATNADPEIAGTGVIKVTGTGTTGVFTVSATSLAASSGYSYKAYATNSEGTTYSSVGTFTTLAPPAVAPTVTTPTSASVTITTAVLGGNVTGDGGAAITARGVVYAPTATNANPEIGGTGVLTEVGTGTTGVFTVNVSALTSSTGYSFKAYATNSVGTSYSSVGTFTTLATPAEIEVTGKGSNIADGSTSPSTGNDTDFGSVPVQGVTVEKTYTINNLGETALTLGTASASGDFTISQQPTSPVAGGGSTTLKVSFNPSAEGLRTASVSFTNSDSDESPFNFDIQGTGTGPQTFDLATNPLANTPYDDGETYILTIAAVPTVVSPTKTGVGSTSATLGGNVTVDGGAITERGVLVSSTDNTPTIAEVGSGVTKFTTAGTTGVFTVSASALTQGTTYYYVAYATNGLGTGYTSVDSFTTTTGPVLPEPVPTSLGDVVSFGDAPGEDGSASVGEFGKLLRGGFIAENGFLVFPGTLEIDTGSPAVTAATDSGLWKVGAGNLFLLARSGTTVPDVAGAQFDTLPEVPGINDAGEVSFLGTLIIGTGGVTIDNDTGMWSEIGGTGLSLLMREDDDVPGFAGAKVKAFASGLYSTAHTGATTGEAAFSVTYKGASTKTALLRASVSGATTTITEIAREGEAAPGTTANFTNLAGSYVDPGRMDAQGNFAFAALTTPGSKDGIWYQPVGGSVSNVVFRGDVAPGTTGATFSKIYRPSMGSNGVIAFRAAVANNTGDNTGNIRNDGIWRVDSANPAGMTCILRRGDDSSVVSNLPGVSRVGNVWGGWLANSNRGAWKAWLDVNGNFTSATNDGDVHAIYTDLSGSMQLGVAVGDAAPGTTGASFSGFDLPVVGGNDQYAFLGTLAGGDTTADNNQGVWKSAASGGALTLVIRKGDVISTTEGNKTVEKMDFPGSNQNDRRWEQPVMDSTGLTVINITFTDGSTSQIQAP